MSVLCKLNQDIDGEMTHVVDVYLPHAPRVGEYLWLPWVQGTKGHGWKVLLVAYWPTNDPELAKQWVFKCFLEVEPA